MRKLKNERGSYTVEISMIFTLIVFAVITLLFTFLYMHQKALLVNAASFAAQQGAELWLDSRRSMEDGRVDNAEAADPINYRIFDNLLFTDKTYVGYIEEEADGKGGQRPVFKIDSSDGLPGKKVQLIQEALCRKIYGTVLKPKSTKIIISYKNNAFRGKLTVEILQEIAVPLGGLKAFFDGKNTLTLSGKSYAVISEPQEYIRNIDLAVELSRRLGGKLDFQGLMDKIRRKK